MKSKLKDNIDKIIRKAGKKTAAISAAIVEKDQVIYKNYHGFIDGDYNPNSKAKMMMIGSNTKIITAIAIFQLYEQGLIDLDCDITKYIKGLKIKSRFESTPITIRNILMHRSGLISDDYDLLTSNNKTSKDILDIVKNTSLSNKPGTVYSYSNVGYGVLGYIIETIAKMDYISYVKKHILKPLDMGLIFIKAEEEKENHKRVLSESFDNNLKVTNEALMTIFSAGANVYGTLEDLVKLIQVFINPEEQSVLKVETIKEMLKKPVIEGVLDGEMMHGNGLIFSMYNYNSETIGDVVSHGGDTKYHHSRFVFMPKINAGFIVMTNTLNGFAVSGEVISKIMNEYIKYKQIELQPIVVPASKWIKEEINPLNLGTYQGNLSITIDRSKDNQMLAKIKFFKMKLQLREDGFYEPKPIGISKLPMFSNYLKRLLFCFSDVNGLRVLSAKEYGKFHYNSAKIGALYKEIEQANKYNGLKGSYIPVCIDNHSDRFIDSLTINIIDNRIIIKMKMWDIDNSFYLSNLDNKLYIQGFSRHSGDELVIVDESTIKLFGLNFKKQ